ncbi:DUF6746 family protein [Marinobacter halophilus]|uniref:Soluble cytochrome b562 n=1 Tax=Marinobacter halophilus TaxID=1323740 RepID=A0A2T1KIQ0_9GAMM|nr:DUF6746 family protein [Marinobacter halophilus]PSF10036.1 hypothetical protein C7H08_00595 [Marinobacter halophilus]GGC67198.1 hypothetical protein GCM10011362_14610 [Marinobacter halophilus]
MKQLIAATLTATAFAFSSPLFASDVEHFKGKSSETMSQAVANFSEYNNKLEQVLSGEMTPEAMNEVHELTYTLENALAKINEELRELADTLEEVHIASEHADGNAVRKHGKNYLKVSRDVIK